VRPLYSTGVSLLSRERFLYISSTNIFHYLIFVWTCIIDCRPATSWVHYTTSCNAQYSAPEYWQNNCPKHFELTGIINKPLLLHLVGYLYYLYFIILFWDLLNNLNLTLVLKTWRVWWAPNKASKWQTRFNSAFKG